MQKSGLYMCELCDKQFSTRQSKWSHKQRTHPSGMFDNADIEKRVALLEKQISELQSELLTLQNKHKFNVNNNFGASTNAIGNCEQLTININQSSTSVSSSSRGERMSVEDMHPFGEDIADEFISAHQFKECGYSLVKLLQLSHFNPVHPPHMNFIMTPDCCEKAYVLGRDHRWVKVDFHTTLLASLWKIVKRLKTVNPTEASRYEDDTSFLLGGMESISLKAIQGVAMYSRTCVKILSEMGVSLPGDLV